MLPVALVVPASSAQLLEASKHDSPIDSSVELQVSEKQKIIEDACCQWLWWCLQAVGSLCAAAWSKPT
jgi:hypothetical protein